MLLAASAVLVVYPVSSEALTCGQVLTTSTTLAADLECSETDGVVLAAPGVTLDLGGYEIRCTSGSTCATGGNGALAGVAIAAPSTTVKGPGRITGFIVGVWDGGEQLPGTTVQRVVIDGAGALGHHGIYGIENVRSNVVMGCGTAVRLLDNARRVQDNLITTSNLGIDIALRSSLPNLRLVHNRIVACTFGLSFGPGSSVSASSGAVKQNVLVANDNDFIDQSPASDLPLATNLCLKLHPLSTSGACSTSPILSGWPAFKP